MTGKQYALLSALCLIILLPAVALANNVQVPLPTAADPRIKNYVYGPDTIYSYKGFYRYQSSIEFEYGEEIQEIAMGDSTGWQITPAGHRLFLKPVDEEATTNMTIYTDKRIYFFELYAGEAAGIRDNNLSFVVRFVYPGEDSNRGAFRSFTHDDEKEREKLSLIDEVPPMESAALYNFNYTLSGSDEIMPVKIFDDGEFTYLQFKALNADVPAIFHVNKYGEESLVNYRISGNYVVVERVSSQYTLRLGEHVACIFNEGRPMQKVEQKKFLGIF